MSKFSKEFYVDKYDLENMSSFTVSRHPVPMRDRTLKITITYDIDREVAVKESDIDNAFNVWGETGMDGFKKAFKQKLFGGGENE